MGLPPTPSDRSPGKSEQIEPLDLRINNIHMGKSPTLHKRRPWIYQNKPLDLRVRRDNIDSIFPSTSLNSQHTKASEETSNRQSNASTPNSAKTSSDHQFESIFEKSHLNEKATDVELSNKSSPHSIFPSDPIVKEDQRLIHQDQRRSTNEGLISCATVSSDFKGEKIEVGSKLSQNLQSLPVEVTCQNSVNETQSGYLMETVENISLWLTMELDKSNMNTESLSINKSENDASRKMKRIARTKSITSIISSNQELRVKECKHTNNNKKYIERNSEKVHDIVENLSQNGGGNEPCPKKMRFEPSASPSQNLFIGPSVQQLKKKGESFLQDGKCFEVAPNLQKCRECSLLFKKSEKPYFESDNVLCRFYAFRKLRYSTRGFLATAGFLNPHTDATLEDLRLWQPIADAPPPDLELQMARFTLTHVGDQFCDLCKQEIEALSIHSSKDKTVAWKRLVPGFREMCDMCNTTLFNYHWTCRKCGFDVCIDCYKAEGDFSTRRVQVERHWLMCTNNRAHVKEKLMLTQIIPADSLKHLRQKAHEIRTSLGLQCSCSPPPCSSALVDHSQNEFTMKNVDEYLIEELAKNKEDTLVDKINSLDNEALGDVGSATQICDLSFEDYYSNTEEYEAKFNSSLQNRLTKLCPIPVIFASNGNPKENNMTQYADMLEEANMIVIEQVGGQDSDTPKMAMRIMTLTESQMLYPDCPHSWLCEGRLLKLSDPTHIGNCRLFQDQWKRGQPVLVSGVEKFLDQGLWQPESFIREFGDTKNDLVDCITGEVIPNQYMRKFWDGFQNVSEMLRDEKGNPILLKLKDWPPGEDFAELLPSRFHNVMKSLPLGEYTKRSGQLNLPSRLPSCFARPDLGPKMYSAYGSATHPTKGTTNLHLDISDAVNVMVYAGIPKDIDHEEYIKEVYRSVDEACFEMLMKPRVREPSEVPGALWHIYSARDADKIRHLLTRVAREQQIMLGPHQDPIHDQTWYLDTTLCERLYKEYDVRGYAIVQCLGDAVYIPAGAPHQVRNLLNCIKVAEDFVSPENVSHCLHLTQEFRKLSDFHTNHEDKLQIKNIIYHAVKDSVSVLSQ